MIQHVYAVHGRKFTILSSTVGWVMGIRFSWLSTAMLLLTVLLCASVADAQWTTVFQAGAPGRGDPVDGVGGGLEVDFVQERDGATPPPGSAINIGGEGADRDVDDDYYFAGEFPAPIGVVTSDEIAFERAFTGTDLDLRIHFNLSDALNDADRFRFSYEAYSIHDAAENPDPRFGVEILVNDTMIFSEQLLRPDDLNTVFTSPEFTAADVGLVGGAGMDNIVTVRGVSYNDDGGGNWMGIDYHHLEAVPVPEPTTISLLVGGLILLIPLLWHEKARLFGQA